MPLNSNFLGWMVLFSLTVYLNNTFVTSSEDLVHGSVVPGGSMAPLSRLYTHSHHRGGGAEESILDQIPGQIIVIFSLQNQELFTLRAVPTD